MIEKERKEELEQRLLKLLWQLLDTNDSNRFWNGITVREGRIIMNSLPGFKHLMEALISLELGIKSVEKSIRALQQRRDSLGRFTK